VGGGAVIDAGHDVALLGEVGALVQVGRLLGQDESTAGHEDDQRLLARVVRYLHVQLERHRPKEQGRLRSDILPPDLPLIQLMLGAVTEHFAEPELWRRYLALILDGMRDRPDLIPLPELRMSQGQLGHHLG
jgi:hypothetical protein